MTTRKLLLHGATTAMIGAGILALSAGAASADVVCNSAGDCWHAKTHYDYQPSFGLTVHPDNWHWGVHDKNRWREHAGRGYWRNGVWLTF